MGPRAWNKFATPCSNLTSFGSKFTVLQKSAHDIAGTFWPPAVIRRRGVVPPCPFVTSLVLCNENRKISENGQIFKSARHEHLQFSKTIRHGSCTDWQQRLLAAFQVSSCSFVSLPCLPHAFLRCGPVFVLLIIKHFGHSTSNFLRLDTFEDNFWIVLEVRFCSVNVQ